MAYIFDLLSDDFAIDSIYHVLSWSSYKAKSSVCSIGAAKILSVGDSTDEGKMLSCVLSSVYKHKLLLTVALDSKDLSTELSTQRNSIDHLIRVDVNVI